MSHINRIRELRETLGLTQAELAGRVRVSAPTVYRWERGVHVPRAAHRRRLSRIFRTAEDGLALENKA